MALKWRHAGQACITANRVFVQKGVYEKFANILAAKTKELVVGHGADQKSTMGPVTTERSLDKAEAQVADATKLGGKILLGGKKLHGTPGYDGYFFEPTLITGAKDQMLIAQEETFAPVMALFEFDTEEEAVARANDTSMGLASYFFTKNIDRTWRLLENLEAGMIGERFLVARSLLSQLTPPRHEHWQLLRGRGTIWWHQGVGLRKGERQGCRYQRISHYQDGNAYSQRPLLGVS